MTFTVRLYYLLGASALLLAAFAVYWLITPADHPDAGRLQYSWAWAQVLGGIALAGWSNRRARALKASQNHPT